MSHGRHRRRDQGRRCNCCYDRRVRFRASSSGCSGWCDRRLCGITIRSRSDKDRADGTLEVIGSNTVLVVHNTGLTEGLLVGLTGGLTSRVESSWDLENTRASSISRLDNSVICSVVQGPTGRVSRRNVEDRRFEHPIRQC